jgi:hypothetical protein
MITSNKARDEVHPYHGYATMNFISKIVNLFLLVGIMFATLLGMVVANVLGEAWEKYQSEWKYLAVWDKFKKPSSVIYSGP